MAYTANEQPAPPDDTTRAVAAPVGEQPRSAAPAGEQPRSATPVGEQPRSTAPAGEQPRSAAPVGEQPRSAAPAGEQPRSAAPAVASAGEKKPGLFFLSEDRLGGLLDLNETPVLRAIRHGVMLVLPLLLAAAVATLINNFPLTAYQTFMGEIFGPRWKEPGAILYSGTIEILALVTSFTLSDSLMYLHNQQRPSESVLPIVGMMTSFVCLCIMIGPTSGAEGGLLLPWAGIRGLFGSLLITFCACFVFLRLARIKKLRLSLYSEGADPILPHMFDTLLPVLGTIGCFVLLRELLAGAGVRSLHEAFYQIIRDLFANAGDSFGLGALYAFLVQICWFFGIHGADLLDPITHQVLVRGMELNSLALNSHQLPPHIFTKYFFDVYIYMGGSGTTLGLLAAVFLRSRDQGTRRVAALSLVPGLFNINELLVFGLPIVLNPAFLLPFVLAPLVVLLISYAAVSLHLAPLPVYQVDWITPPLINALISTDSWRGVLLQLVNLSVATLIYLPFVTLADKTKLLTRRKAFQKLVEIAQSNTRGNSGKRCTDRPGGAGALARSLANDMAKNLKDDDEAIQLHYQPRVNVVGQNVPCVEALLRWQHPFYGTIPAVLTLAIAEDAGLTHALDNHVVRMAFEQQREWRKNRLFTTTSINVSESQLQDPGFPAFLESLYASNNLPADAILLEIQESLALDPEGSYQAAMQAIHATGAGIAVDDFGKGYQAIAQIKRLPLAELQIDRSLIRDVAENRGSQDVIGTIQEMCHNMGIKTSAEFIESPEQLEMLLELNFSTFQGYYFSEPVPAERCAEFIRSVASKGLVSRDG